MNAVATLNPETFEAVRRRELRAKIASLDAAMTENSLAIGAIGIGRDQSYKEGQEQLDALTNQRGQLLTQWSATLGEFAALG